ncbi:MAG: RNA polymerase sigma factor [Oscillospiraceae bacterium]|nr:RNA polymerase sigma factor [Oscillospiraceae bacterium]
MGPLSDNEKERIAFFTGLTEANYTKLIKFAESKISNRVDAEDIAQETLYIAWRKIDVLMKSPNPEGWLVNTLKYRILKYIEGEGERAKLIGALMAVQSEGYEPTLISDVQSLLSRLSDDEIHIVRLKEQGYTHHEIADMLGVPYGTIASKAFRIKGKIEKQLGEEN